MKETKSKTVSTESYEENQLKTKGGNTTENFTADISKDERVKAEESKEDREQEDTVKEKAADIEVDYSNYFREMKGTAVFYNGKKNSYYIYNKELADYQSSPCSTFKIISCLMGLESGVIEPSESVMKWNHTKYPIKDWNQDLDYRQAFTSSGVWYFKRVIDLAGKTYVTDILDKLDYGNQDISYWEGSGINKDSEGNVLLDINGFWLESSLEISPRQQTEVIYKLFEENQVFREANLELVKEVMLIENKESNIKIFGKTGSGKKEDSWSDAWFVGFFEKGNDKTCFAVRLNQQKAKSTDAKEMAVKIINEEFGE
jgi:bla regulator protein BlaR1